MLKNFVFSVKKFDIYSKNINFMIDGNEFYQTWVAVYYQLLLYSHL